MTVGELADAANVSTGAIYHHFGSKLGLYAFVREDVERRLLDRMEGALAAFSPAADRSSAVTAALLVGFDFAIQENFLRILGESPVGAEPDRLAQLLAAGAGPESTVLGRMLAAAWRAALVAVAEDGEPHLARAALVALQPRVTS